MKKSDYKKGDEVDVDLINIIIKVPENTARLKVESKVFDDDGKPITLSNVMNAADIRRARNDFLENVESGDDYDARYVITEEGREWLERLDKKDPLAVAELNKILAEADDEA